MCSGWVYSNSHTRGDWLGNQLVGEDETVDANGQRKGTGKSSRATNLTMRTRIPQFAKKAPSISLGIVFHADSSMVYDVKRRRSSMAIKDRQRLDAWRLRAPGIATFDGCHLSGLAFHAHVEAIFFVEGTEGFFIASFLDRFPVLGDLLDGISNLRFGVFSGHKDSHTRLFFRYGGV